MEKERKPHISTIKYKYDTMNKIFLVLLLTLSLYAQDPFEIMNSPLYRWGKGSGASVSEASAAAKANLINNIISYVIGEVSLTKTEVTEENSSEFGGVFSSFTKTYSKLRLKNLGMMELEPEGDSKLVLVYILHSDFLASVDEVKTECREMTRVAEEKEKKEGTASSFLNYYLAYLNTFYSPEPISYASTVSGDSVLSLKVHLENKIRSFLSGIKIQQSEPFVPHQLQEQIELPLTVTHSGRAVHKLTIKFDNTDNPEREILKGKVHMIIYSQPSQRKQKYYAVLSPSFEEKSELKEMHTQFALTEKIPLTVDYSSVIKLDFTAREESPRVVAFTTEVKNLSISNIEWNFGDGETAHELNPKHLYAKNGSYTVTLTLNADPALTVKKNIRCGDADPVKPPEIKEPVKKDESSKKEEPETSSSDKSFVPPGKGATVMELTEQILRTNTFEELISILSRYKEKGLVIFGNRKDFLSPENCYIIIIDPVTGEMKGLLEPGKSSRKDLVTGTSITDLRDTFKGMKTIWAEVVK